MRTFEIVFKKSTSIFTPQAPPIFAKQFLTTDKKQVDIPTPDGFIIESITELFPPITINEEKHGN